MAQHKPVASDNYYKSTRKIQIWQLSFAPSKHKLKTTVAKCDVSPLRMEGSRELNRKARKYQTRKLYTGFWVQLIFGLSLRTGFLRGRKKIGERSVNLAAEQVGVGV